MVIVMAGVIVNLKKFRIIWELSLWAFLGMVVLILLINVGQPVLIIGRESWTDKSGGSQLSAGMHAFIALFCIWCDVTGFLKLLLVWHPYSDGLEPGTVSWNEPFISSVAFI